MQFLGFGHCLVIMALFFINFGVGLYHGIHFCTPLRGNSDIFVHVDKRDHIKAVSQKKLDRVMLIFEQKYILIHL